MDTSGQTTAPCSAQARALAREYRAVEERWWGALPTNQFDAEQLEALRRHADAARWRSLERIVAAACREGWLASLPGPERGSPRFVRCADIDARGAPPEDAEILVAENFQPALTVLESRFSALWLERGAEDGEALAIDHPADVLAWLAASPTAPARGAPGQWLRLVREVAGSTLNDALCRLHRAAVARELERQPMGKLAPGQRTLLNWLGEHKPAINASLWLEQWSAAGHPLHIVPKNRDGIQPADVLAFFPEFGPEFELRLGAIACAASAWEVHPSLSGLVSWLGEELPDAIGAWRDWLRSLGRDPEDFLPLPLHPLQRRKCLPPLLAESDLGDAELLTDGPHIPCSPTLSVRTVVPHASVAAPHLKLALGVRLTSMRRNISPRSCIMGPRISALLESVIAGDEQLRGSIAIAPELAGLCLDRPDPRGGGPLRDLAAIFRRNPCQCVATDETPIPASALPLVSPLSRQPLLLELHGSTPDPEAAAGAIHRYAELLLAPVLRLFFTYGILLEAHPQNAFLVVARSGAPRRLLIRDLGGIRIHEPTLRARGFELQVHEDRLTVSDDWGVARRRLIHAVFQWHLGHLVWAVARHVPMDEAVLWRAVRDVTAVLLERHRDELPAGRWNAERRLLLESAWEAKSSIRMRLDDTQDELFVPAPNPLRGDFEVDRKADRSANLNATSQP